MQCWRSNTEDEAVVESTILTEICLIHHFVFKQNLASKTTLLFVKCRSSTLYEISKMHKPLYLSATFLRDNKLIIYEKKTFSYTIC